MKNNFTSLALILVQILALTGTLMAQPEVSWQTNNAGVIEEGFTISLPVLITNPDSNPTTVLVKKQAGSATEGDDFTFEPDTITFPGGSSADQIVNITLIDDCDDENGETAFFLLYEPTNGANIGIQTIIVSIADNDDAVTEDCTYTVPGNTMVVQGSHTNLFNNRTFWVCEGSDMAIQANNNTALLEGGSQAHVPGDNNILFVKSGGWVVVNGGEQNIIYVENGSTVDIQSGNCNVVFGNGGVNITDNGSGTILNDLDCGTLTIDYSNAPTPGCEITATAEIQSLASIHLYPNPTNGSFTLLHDPELKLHYYEVFSEAGARVMKVTGEKRILPEPAGMYILKLVFDDGVKFVRIIKAI